MAAELDVLGSDREITSGRTWLLRNLLGLFVVGVAYRGSVVTDSVAATAGFVTPRLLLLAALYLLALRLLSTEPSP